MLVFPVFPGRPSIVLPFENCQWHVSDRKKTVLSNRLLCWHYLAFRVGQRIVLAGRDSPVDCRRQEKSPDFSVEAMCWHYLSSRAVARQVLSAQMSLTSVFGMGTGGPSLQSIPTLCGWLLTTFMSKPFGLNALDYSTAYLLCQ